MKFDAATLAEEYGTYRSLGSTGSVVNSVFQNTVELTRLGDALCSPERFCYPRLTGCRLAGPTTVQDLDTPMRAKSLLRPSWTSPLAFGPDPSRLHSCNASYSMAAAVPKCSVTLATQHTCMQRDAWQHCSAAHPQFTQNPENRLSISVRNEIAQLPRYPIHIPCA